MSIYHKNNYTTALNINFKSCYWHFYEKMFFLLLLKIKINNTSIFFIQEISCSTNRKSRAKGCQDIIYNSGYASSN